MSGKQKSIVPFNNLDELAALTICKLDSWALSSLTGEERATYLNGQVTIDVTKLSTGDSSLGAHCDAKGKMHAAFRLFVFEDELILAQKQSTFEQQMAAIKKFAVFSKVEINPVEQWSLYGIAGKQAAEWVQQRQGELGEKQGKQEIIVELSLPTTRFLVLTKEVLPENSPESIWQALDIAAGTAQLELETQLQFIPQMLNLQLLDAISFTKGCYIGQETVARAKYRGTNKRATFLIKGSAQQAAQAGDIVEQQLDTGNWRKAGTVLQAVQFNDKHVELLAVLPKDIEHKRPLRLKNNESSDLTLAIQPYPFDEE